MIAIGTLHRPGTPEEAHRLLSETEGNGLYLAGGTTIVPAGSPHLDFLVDVTDCGMSHVRSENSSLAIGAAVRVAELISSPLVAKVAGGLISEAARVLASPIIRNLATVGGNVVAWHYPSDLPPVLLALNASLTLLGSAGPRDVSIEDFYVRRREVFRPRELIVRFSVPVPGDRIRGAFEKLGRTEVDVAIVNCAVTLSVKGDRIGTARIALGGVGPVPVRAKEAEAYLEGKDASASTFEAAARLSASSLSPSTDLRASAAYRTRVSEVLVRRALVRAAGSGE